LAQAILAQVDLGQAELFEDLQAKTSPTHYVQHHSEHSVHSLHPGLWHMPRSR